MRLPSTRNARREGRGSPARSAYSIRELLSGTWRARFPQPTEFAGRSDSGIL
jgi:hypothetical protein